MKVISTWLLFTPIALSSGNTIRRRESDARIFKERIIGGFEATEGRFSYAVSLQDPTSGHFCGGSLIAPDVVLSAAHCAGGRYNVVIKRHDLDERDGDVISKKREVPHPQYNPTITDNDFNLIFLTRETTATAAMVKLNKNSGIPSAGDPVEVMGWGDTDPSDWSQQLTDELHSVEVNVVSNRECAASKGYVGWFNYESYENSITSNMLCARDTNQDSCQGDSGGPLVIKGKSRDGSDDVQVGVVSWGIGCADSSFPGVYARVSSAYEWIQTEVCNRSLNPPASFECGGGAGGGNGVFENVKPPAPTPPVTVPVGTLTPPQPFENTPAPVDTATTPQPTPFPSPVPTESFFGSDDDDDMISTVSDGWSSILCFFFGCR